jgi:hypothetical protein
MVFAISSIKSPEPAFGDNSAQLLRAETKEAIAICQRWIMTGHILIGRSRESLALGRSAGFQTGLKRVGGLADTFQPEDMLSRFGNQRSAKHTQR